MQIPVIIINGFLESGKTFFINDALFEDSFALESRTLLLLCEEGIEEYDAKTLTKNAIQVHTLESQEEFSDENLANIVKQYRPNLVIIEMNGMWDMQKLKMPAFFNIEEQVTVINAQTFTTYFSNMRQKFVDMVRPSNLIIVNRCNDEKEAANIKRTLRMINQNAGYALLDGDNNEMHPADDLPFKLDEDIIKIPDDAYGIWYMDTFDSHSRYEGKTVEFNAMVVFSKKLPPKSFVAGRIAMTCCVADQQLIGHLCKTNIDFYVKDRSWVDLKAVVHYVFSKQNNEQEAVLEVLSLKPIAEIEHPILKLT